eukprot:g2673.t1
MAERRLLGLVLAVLVSGSVLRASASADEKSDGVVRLSERTFEHLTQAATGATTGEWLVCFCQYPHKTCDEMDVLWQGLAKKLGEMVEVNPDGPRINVATVDLTKATWLQQRFQIGHSPTVLLFRHGWMHLYNRRMDTVKKRQQAQVANLIKFVEKGWSEAPSMPVPPEPHVPTEHELTFNYFVGGTCILCFVCFLLDLWLKKRNYEELKAYQKEVRQRERAKAGKDKPKGD